MVKFIVKKLSSGFFYTLGKIILYLALGFIIYMVVKYSNINPGELYKYVM